MNSLLEKLQLLHPHISFRSGDSFYWSAENKTVFYSLNKKSRHQELALLHELAHALLNHRSYSTDFQLLRLEVEAWEYAKELAKHHNVTASSDHIEDCLDSYRDWLHDRSTCPNCGEHGLQDSSQTYICLNCAAKWHVSASRFCRVYRRKSSVNG